MPKLNQIIAVEKGVKQRSYEELTKAHHALEKNTLLAGISRTYQPKDEEGDKLPPESTRVQVRAPQMIAETQTIMTELFDVTATKDWANCEAKADVMLDGEALLTDVPVTYLLFLEKQLVDLHTFVSKLPVLDQAESWTYDSAADAYATQPAETTRTKKIPRNHIKYEATKEHPAQVDVYTEDVIVGTWRTIKFSGALPAARVRELTERVEALQQAVKYAREEANSLEVDSVSVGDALFGYLFA